MKKMLGNIQKIKYTFKSFDVTYKQNFKWGNDYRLK